MTDEDQFFLGFTVQEIIRWSIVLLIVVAGFGSIIDGGALSGDYQQSDIMVYIPTLLFLYFAILAALIASGLNPNKFETVFIPTLIVAMIVVALFYANLIPPATGVDNGSQPTIETTQTDEEIIRSSITSDNQTYDGTVNTNTLNNGSDGISILWQNVLTSLSIIGLLMFLGMVLYWLVNRKEFDPDIQLHKVSEYTKSSFESNNTIIEYYIDASNKIETLKGRAPDWYSPTFFSGHVIDSPGPPLSSYFDQLTQLYEKARFGKVKMGHDEVEEVKELHHQVINQINMIIEELRKSNSEEGEE